MVAYRALKYPGLSPFSQSDKDGYKAAWMAFERDGKTPGDVAKATAELIAQVGDRTHGVVNPNTIRNQIDGLLIAADERAAGRPHRLPRLGAANETSAERHLRENAEETARLTELYHRRQAIDVTVKEVPCLTI